MTKKLSLSGVILVKNEEKNIKKSIKSLSFCDEIIIIDDYSDDKTVQIAERMKAKVIKSKLNGSFSHQRNFGLEKAKGDWVLFIDADEEITKELRNEIIILIKSRQEEKLAYYIKRRDFWWGRELRFGEIKKVRDKGLIRLVKKNSGKFVGQVHEEFHSLGSVGFLKNFINHYPHPELKDFIKEINFYSTLRAKELVDQGKKTNIMEIIFFPLAKFILNYFFYLGFLDGPAGFGYSFMMSFHSFLVRSKIYQYSKIETKKL